jgi:hypothetical protein
MTRTRACQSHHRIKEAFYPLRYLRPVAPAGYPAG